MQLTEKEAIVEGVLFAAGEMVEISALSEILQETKEKTTSIVENLNRKFLEENRALMIRNIDNAYQICTRSNYHEYIEKLFNKKKEKGLSQASLETLAIIAYKQPITRQEIERLRGVNSDYSVSVLVQYGLVEDTGRLNVPGKPLLYETTKEFLRVFGYSSLKDLPKTSKDLKLN